MLLTLSLLLRLPRFIPTILLFTCIVSQTVRADEFTNFLGMKFVSIPGGTFKMGIASKTFEAKTDELPQHDVAVADFQMMPTEVTLAQYKRYISESANTELLQNEFMEANKFDDNAPVIYISWNDTRYFLHWLNQNKPASDQGEYRLPTEAEWEYACRARRDTLYCGSDTAGEVAWYASNTPGHQQPVAQKRANAFGLYDMSGNVREWVMDCYHANYDNAPSDGTLAWERDCDPSDYVTRGGSWDEGAEASRVTDRLASKFNKQDAITGFRVVRD